MGSKRAGVVISMLIFLIGVPAAHADPGFVLAESQVRAGDTVHFSITGADGRVKYELEVADHRVLEGSGKGKLVSGQFTMPELGSDAKGVTVEAEMRDDDGWEKVKRPLQYLGAALPPPTPEPEPDPPAPPPPALQQTATQAPAPSGGPAVALAAPQATVRQVREPRTRRHARRHRKAVRHESARESQQHARKSERKHKRKSAANKRKRHRPAPRTAPLFDGVPEPGSENYTPDTGAPSGDSHAQPRSVFTRAVASRDEGSALAILIPGLLAFAGLSLTTVTVLRRRRTS